MTIVITGENDFMRLQELKSLQHGFVNKYGDFGLEQIDAGEAELGRLLESISSRPFLAEKRMVIVYNLYANKALITNIGQLLDAAADTTELVLVEPKFDKRQTAYKYLKKHADFREFNNVDERGLASWLVQEAKKRGGSLKPNDASYLIKRGGINQMTLSNELDKLLSFDANITRQSIDLLVEPLPDSTTFDLLDSAFAGNRKRAMELYQDQRKQQIEPQAIMGMIAWQLHVITLVKLNDSEDAGRVASVTRLNPFVVRKTLNLTRNLTLTRVKELQSKALELDIRLKSEMIDADDAVQHFLLTI